MRMQALLRPGRFDRHIQIDLPTLKERQEVFELYLKRIKLDVPPTKYSNRLAHQTPGFSGADIGNIVNEAAIHAASHKCDKVTIDDLNYALDRVISGELPCARRVADARLLLQDRKSVVALCRRKKK
jgi:spastic paraplegia protein 7